MTYHVIIQIKGYTSNIIRETRETPPDSKDIEMIEKYWTEQYSDPAIVTNVFSTQDYTA